MMRSYQLNTASLGAIIALSLVIGFLISFLNPFVIKLGYENAQPVPSIEIPATNIEGENHGSIAAEESKESNNNSTSGSSRLAELPVDIFNQSDFKDFFYPDKYYQQSKFAFKKYHWSDISGILGVGFINKTNEADCGEKAAFTEWILERNGINTSIVVANIFPGTDCSHAWAKVVTSLNETIFIDLAGSLTNDGGSDYQKFDDAHKHFDKEFKDIFEAERNYSDTCSKCRFHFAWWKTSWGKDKLKDLGFYENKTIMVSGSTTVYPIIEEAAKAFDTEQIGCAINVSDGGTVAGITNIAENRSDIAMASRKVNANEKKKYGDNFKEFIIGYQGVTIAVSNSVYDGGVKGLTTEQVMNIYAGKIRNWRELGGPDKEIYVIAKKPGTDDSDNFNKSIMNSGIDYTPGVSLVAQNNTQVRKAMVSRDNAIGYLRFSYLDSANISGVAIDNVLPSLQSIRNESYKLYHPSIYLYTFGEPTPCAQKFIDYITKSKGRDVVADYGYIPT